MARLKSAKAVLAAAELWKKRCLLDGTSLLTEDRLWMRGLFEKLHDHVVDHPDEGTDSFLVKLRRQLSATPPEANRLWAEMSWIFYLILTNVKRTTKLDRIRTVWNWSGEDLNEDHSALGSVLEKGVVNSGTAYLTHSWREYFFIVAMMRDWFAKPREDRESLLRDHWGFAKWVDSQERSMGRQFRHAVLYLLFPDYFENCMTTGHKELIVTAYSRKLGSELDVRKLSLTELDQGLYDMRQKLESESTAEEIDFFTHEYKKEWDPEANSTDPVDGEDAAAWCRKRFGEANVWAISPGDGARLWQQFQELGIVAIRWDDLGDLREYATKDSIRSALIESGLGPNPSMSALAAWQFTHEMKTGDTLLAKKGRTTILGIGTVTGEYTYDSNRREYMSLRAVDWSPCKPPIILPGSITTKSLTYMSQYPSWLRKTFIRLDQQRKDPEPSPVPIPYIIGDALKDLFMEDAQFSRILDSIALRKNLILQGPPGVGKTFVAKRIAWCLIGWKHAELVEMVQFHQSYAYEDFVQGWRPTESGGFNLRNGVFFEFCKRAEKRPDDCFVFIIDEINRGNLAKIFGELLMLIEADKRGSNHAIALTYSSDGQRFSVPDNVHLLGLMNTADRSVAIVDYALRRRFAFETLRPAFESEKFRDYLLEEQEVDRELVDHICRRFSELNRKIREDKDLGPGFEIGHSYFVLDDSSDEQWYRNVIDTQIKPLLSEYWFERVDTVNRWVGRLRR